MFAVLLALIVSTYSGFRCVLWWTFTASICSCWVTLKFDCLAFVVNAKCDDIPFQTRLLSNEKMKSGVQASYDYIPFKLQNILRDRGSDVEKPAMRFLLDKRLYLYGYRYARAKADLHTWLEVVSRSYI